MAPTPVLNRYKLYKTGTAKVVQWLAATAGRCCDLTKIVGSLQPKPRDQKKKNNRKKASSRNKPKRNPAAAVETPDILRESKTVHILSHELPLLAEAIVSSGTTQSVPGSIIKLLENVIVGRQECAEWYAAHTPDGDGDLTKQNEGHTHFIRTLRKVRATLAAVQQTGLQDTIHANGPVDIPPVNHDTENVDKANYSFAHLRFDELLDNVQEIEPASSSTKASIPVFELQDEGDDLLCEFWCLLEDMHDVQGSIREAWLEYNQGTLTLMAASVLTDAAFGLIRRANDEFTAAHPDFKDYWHVHKFLDLGTIDLGNNDEVLILSMALTKGNRLSKSRTDPTELLCPLAAVLLRTFGDETAKFVRQAMELETPDDIDVFSFFPSHGLGRILASMVPDIVRYAVGLKKRGWSKSMVVGDDFLRGLFAYGYPEQKRTLPIWLVVACQIYMDIFDLTGRSVFQGPDMLCDWLTSAVCDINDYHEHSAESEGRFLKPIWNETFKGLNDAAPDLIKAFDIVAGAGMDVDTSDIAATHLDGAPLQPFVKLPLSSPIMLYHNKIRLHEVATVAASDGMVVLSVAHLYRAAHHLGIMSTPWTNMDFLLAQNSGKQMLVNDFDEVSAPYCIAKEFQKAMGVPKSSLGRHNRVVRPSLPSLIKSCRKISVTSPLVASMLKHINTKQNANKYNRQGDIIEAVLQDLMRVETTAGVMRTKARFTPAQLLRTLKKNLTLAEPALSFDYLRFYQRCGEIMKTLKAKMLPTLDDSTVKEVETAYELVDYLLWDAGDALQSQSPISVSRFAQAAKILEAAFSSQADEFTKDSVVNPTGSLKKGTGNRSGDSWSKSVSLSKSRPGRQLKVVYDPDFTPQKLGERLLLQANAYVAKYGRPMPVAFMVPNDLGGHSNMPIR